ncbi:UNKNOWN [Stylonychia lemnae]|uniref:Uncharacterized protein n=1 Tax=Stylonychia lemnae TaxID=5949 RepID=A0A078AS11_STYLE|nr:UNKNOWN [Stylonychia lemnae]|eukprot:CDW84959.1 UNKNOWN [Stylonychia lemnae]
MVEDNEDELSGNNSEDEEHQENQIRQKAKGAQRVNNIELGDGDKYVFDPEVQDFAEVVTRFDQDFYHKLHEEVNQSIQQKGDLTTSDISRLQREQKTTNASKKRRYKCKRNQDFVTYLNSSKSLQC